MPGPGFVFDSVPDALARDGYGSCGSRRMKKNPQVIQPVYSDASRGADSRRVDRKISDYRCRSW